MKEVNVQGKPSMIASSTEPTATTSIKNTTARTIVDVLAVSSCGALFEGTSESDPTTTLGDQVFNHPPPSIQKETSPSEKESQFYLIGDQHLSSWTKHINNSTDVTVLQKDDLTLNAMPEFAKQQIGEFSGNTGLYLVCCVGFNDLVEVSMGL